MNETGFGCSLKRITNEMVKRGGGDKFDGDAPLYPGLHRYSLLDHDIVQI